MNKYIIIVIILVVIILGGGIYRAYFLPEIKRPVSSGVERNITIISKKNEWRFIPEIIEINRGDKVILTLINEDDYDHGIGIDAYGISSRMPANESVVVNFIASQEGDFRFFCSVPCGGGLVDGEERDHFDMLGTIKVRGLISETR